MNNDQYNNYLQLVTPHNFTIVRRPDYNCIVIVSLFMAAMTLVRVNYLCIIHRILLTGLAISKYNILMLHYRKFSISLTKYCTI